MHIAKANAEKNCFEKFLTFQINNLQSTDNDTEPNKDKFTDMGGQERKLVTCGGTNVGSGKSKVRASKKLRVKRTRKQTNPIIFIHVHIHKIIKSCWLQRCQISEITLKKRC